LILEEQSLDSDVFMVGVTVWDFFVKEIVCC